MAFDTEEMVPPEVGVGNSSEPTDANPAEEQVPEENPSPLDEIEEDLQKAILKLIDDFEDEDRFVREKQLRRWKKNEAYWNNLQNVFWSDLAGEWASPTQEQLASIDVGNMEPEDFEKIINIYKAHGEAVIAALSVQLPAISFYPDDADSPEDISTAKAFTKIAELVQKHNRGALLFVKALYHRWISGVVFCYNHFEESEDYGTVQRPDFKMVEQQMDEATCKNCGMPMFPEDQVCAECGAPGPPEVSSFKFEIPQLVGYSDSPKGRTCMDVFGPMHIKIGQNVRRQKDTPYLLMRFEQYTSLLKGLYPWLYDKITPDYPNKDYYERWSRTGLQYFGDYPDNKTGVVVGWIRPWAFNHLGDADLAARLRERFPKGLYVVKVGEELADVREEALDDHWTVSEDPFSENLHPEPLGQPLMPIQDMTNELFRLTIETVEYGIPETFASPDVLDFDKFEQQEVRPGMVSPAEAPPGKDLSAGFHTLQTATLSKEIEPFANRLESAGQFVSSSFPSIYGGPSEAGSKTASEYSQSRAQALQRLGPYWKSMSFFWCYAVARACKEFAQNMQEDERDVSRAGSGFINVWIRKSELAGRIGKVEPEVNDSLPLSQYQKRDLILRLFEMQSPEINAVLFSPTNANIMKSVIGLTELDIPGEEDRNKQIEEIQVLLQGQPLDPNGQESSVPVDFEIEDHAVEGMVLRDWLISEEGQFHKKVNPAGYANCVAHYRQHKIAEQIKMMQEMPPAPAPTGAPNEGGDNVS